MALGSADYFIPHKQLADVPNRNAEVFDTLSDSWIQISDYPFSKEFICRFSVIFLQDAFYIIGGLSDEAKFTNTIARLDNLDWTWSQAKDFNICLT